MVSVSRRSLLALGAALPLLGRLDSGGGRVVGNQD